LRYAIRQNDTPPNVASVRLVFNVGSLAEAEDQRGLAHFIEHMAFNGSTEVPEGEMVPLLERHGLQFGPDTNAFTGYETVGYQLDIPEVDEETVDTALFLMRQTASELLMDSEAIDRERGVILSEERFRNTPIRRWNTALWRFRLPDSRVPDRDAIGTVDVIENAQRERFVDYYENYYVPQRGMLVVVGDVDPDTIEAKIRDEFADWQSIEDPRGDPDIGSVTEGRPLSVGYFHDPEIYTLCVPTRMSWTPPRPVSRTIWPIWAMPSCRAALRR
jgi:zinc protease